MKSKVTRVYDFLWLENVEPGEGRTLLESIEPGERVRIRINGFIGTWERSAPYTHKNSPALWRAPTFDPVEPETIENWTSIPKYGTVDIEVLKEIPDPAP